MTHPPLNYVERKDLEAIVLVHSKEAARQAMAELEAVLGVDLADKTQREAVRRDLAFLRTLRAGTHFASAKVGSALILITVSALAIALWEGVKRFALIPSPPH